MKKINDPKVKKYNLYFSKNKSCDYKSYRDQLYAIWVETSKSLPSEFLIPKPKEFVPYKSKKPYILRERERERERESVYSISK